MVNDARSPYGKDPEEALVRFISAMRGDTPEDLEDAREALEYWLFIVRAKAPDLSDQRVLEAMGVPRWAEYSRESPPPPGLYICEMWIGGHRDGASLRMKQYCKCDPLPDGVRMWFGPIPKAPGDPLRWFRDMRKPHGENG